MAHCECILDTQSCNECPSYVDAESSKVVKGQFPREKILTCYFGEHITHLHISDIVTFETDITDT